MRAIHGLVLVVAAVGATGAARAADSRGLTVPSAVSGASAASLFMADGAAADSTLLPRWRSRVALGFALPGWVPVGLGSDFGGTARPALASVRLLGDYYFVRPSSADGRASGFRATSGLIVGPRSGAWTAAGDASSALSIERHSFGLLPPAAGAVGTARAVPYLGVGYSDSAAKGRWGFSADIGVMALNPSSGLRYGRGAGAQSVDDVLRDLRLAPVLQLGVSYAF